jgi:hypothetical protein
MASLVGAGEIDNAKAVLSVLQELAPEYVRNRLEGASQFGRPQDHKRYQAFLRITAGLEDPSAAAALR